MTQTMVKNSCTQQYTPKTPVLGRLKQKDLEFLARYNYIVKPCLKTPNQGQGRTQ